MRPGGSANNRGNPSIEGGEPPQRRQGAPGSAPPPWVERWRSASIGGGGQAKTATPRATCPLRSPWNPPLISSSSYGRLVSLSSCSRPAGERPTRRGHDLLGRTEP